MGLDQVLPSGKEQPDPPTKTWAIVRFSIHMEKPARERISEICALIADEKNSVRFHELVTQLIKILDEKAGLHAPRPSCSKPDA